MLIHRVQFGAIGFVLFLLLLLRDLLEAVIFDFLDDPVDGDDEVEHKDQEDDHLEEDRVDVEGAGHFDRRGEGRDAGKAFVGNGEEIWKSHILFSKII